VERIQQGKPLFSWCGMVKAGKPEAENDCKISKSNFDNYKFSHVIAIATRLHIASFVVNIH
jgi:hypothetical protein